MNKARITKAYAETSAGQIHYRYLVGEGTPIVFFHQTASSGAMYEKLMGLLAGRNPMFALDTPGFGGSCDPQGDPSMPQYADWMVEALDALGLTHFHMFGHHTGVCIGAEIAVKHPDRVKSLMMVGPVPLTDDEREEFRKHFSTPISPRADGAYLKQTWDYLQTLGAHQSLELHHRELLDTTRAYLGRSKAYAAVWDQDFPKLYAQLGCPMLLLCARDDVLWPFFERAQQQRPDAVAAEIEGANFEPDLDPQGIEANVRSFLDSIGG